VVILVVGSPALDRTWERAGRDLIPCVRRCWHRVMFNDMANDRPTYTDADHTALVASFYQEINNSGLGPRSDAVRRL
jgi:hypothetical protein